MTDTPKYTIFISYRQSDDGDFTGRINDYLANRYGRENVFLDTYSIRPFSNFKETIRERLEKSDAVLMVIGTQWLELLNTKAQLGEIDYLLFELETALSMKKVIAPVLIKGARMPRIASVPASLHPLLDIHFAKIDTSNFYNQIESLIEHLEWALQEHVGNINTLPSAEEYFRQGKEKYQSGDYADAIASFNQAIRLDPNYTDAYNHRGFSHKAIGDYAAAIADYNQAVRLDPNNVKAYYNRGFSHKAIGDYAGAIASFNQAIRLDLNDAKLYYNRGFLRRKTDDHEGAITDYTEAIRLDPNNVIAYLYRGFSLSQKGDYLAAIADYSEVIRLDPNNTIAYLNRGKSHEAKQKYQRAIIDYQKYLDLGGSISDNADEIEATITRLTRLI